MVDHVVNVTSGANPILNDGVPRTPVLKRISREWQSLRLRFHRILSLVFIFAFVIYASWTIFVFELDMNTQYDKDLTLSMERMQKHNSSGTSPRLHPAVAESQRTISVTTSGIPLILGAPTNRSIPIPGIKMSRTKLSKEFHGRLLTYKPISFASKGEDVKLVLGRSDELILDWYFGFNPSAQYNLTFVEFGAGDGLHDSLTLFFERVLKWRGLLVEPSPPNIEKFKKQSSGRLQRSKLITKAVCLPSEGGHVEMIGDGSSAAVLKYTEEGFTAHYRGKWKEQYTKPYVVECAPASEILMQESMTEIDLMVIFVSGSEKAVIDTLDFEKISVRLIVLHEHIETCRSVDGVDMCKSGLEQAGYCRDLSASGFSFYVKKHSPLAQFACLSTSGYAEAQPQVHVVGKW